VRLRRSGGALRLRFAKHALPPTISSRRLQPVLFTRWMTLQGTAFRSPISLPRRRRLLVGKAVLVVDNLPFMHRVMVRR
jgi:hypothetical protein